MLSGIARDSPPPPPEGSVVSRHSSSGHSHQPVASKAGLPRVEAGPLPIALGSPLGVDALLACGPEISSGLRRVSEDG